MPAKMGMKDKANKNRQNKKKRDRRRNAARRNVTLAVNNNERNRPAKLQSAGKGTIVSHTEIIKENLQVTSAFAVSDLFAVQPALTAYSHGSPLGAWLAGVAKEYDNYEFQTLRVHFKTTCSSLTNGQVIMSYDPNPEGIAPISFQSARNAALCQTGPVRENVTLDLTPLVKGRRLLTRSSAVSSYPAYDAGRFTIATSSGVDGTSVGFIEIEYVVRLSNPQTAPSIESATVYAPIMKEQRTWNNATSVWWFGNTNNSTNASYFTYSLGNTPTAAMGASIISSNTFAPRSTDLVWTSPSSGAIYTIRNGMNVHTFKFKRPGLYQINCTIPGDWQNLAEFCSEIVRYPKSQAISTGTPTYTTDVGIDALGNPIAVYSNYYAWRGFKTLDTVGASENCDLALDLSTQVYVGDTDDAYSLFVGIRPVAGIAENGNATYTASNNTAGIPRITFQYLGACEGSNTVTVIA